MPILRSNSTPQRLLRAVALLSALAAVDVISGAASAQKADTPFVTLTGTWSGAGQVRLEGGKTERISCKAYYTPREGGAGVGIALRCASTSYTINLRSQLSSNGGKVTGSWEEQTFNVSGNVSGRASPGSLSVQIVGGGLSGSMSVSFGGAAQQISINTSGAAFKGVSINLSKS